jgi:tetratricopeptide (TPR) repeat protein
MKKSAKQLMEQGWHAREDLRFEEAEDLLNQAYALFIEQEDYFNATECLNHLASTYKLRVGKLMQESINCAEKSLKLSKEKETRSDLVLRELMSVYAAAGQYEWGLPYLQELLDKTEKPANKADYLSHLATFQMRMGDLVSAHTAIIEAEELLEKGWDDEREPHRSIWKVRIILTKALILYNMEDLDRAQGCAHEALAIAKKENLKTRTTQAESVLALFLEK